MIEPDPEDGIDAYDRARCPYCNRFPCAHLSDECWEEEEAARQLAEGPPDQGETK